MKMFNKKLNLKFIFNPLVLRHWFSSALYITGDKAQKTCSVLTPVVDFEKQLADRDALEKNIKARELPLELQKIEERWQFFQNIDIQKKTLEITRVEIGRWIAELMKDAEKNKDEIEKFKLHSKLVKRDLKNVKDYFYGLEEDTMLQLLDLPNTLHERTSTKLVVFHKFLENIQEISPSHIEISEKLQLIEYVNPFTYYFKSDAALFEVGLLNYFRHSLLDLNYTQFSNSDFCRSVVVEGCGISYSKKSNVFLLDLLDSSKDDINRLHLCGAGSLYSFMAFFSKNCVQQAYFPLKYFSIGKKYRPVSKTSKDLFNVSQQSVINVFTATMQEEDVLEELTKQVTDLYEALGYHFRLVYLPANQLDKSESLRVSIQMYSNYLEDYVEVGNISTYNSFLSKRLLFNYTDNKERKYPNIIAGSLVNVPKLLGCVLENNSFTNTNLITPILQRCMFV